MAGAAPGCNRGAPLLAGQCFHGLHEAVSRRPERIARSVCPLGQTTSSEARTTGNARQKFSVRLSFRPFVRFQARGVAAALQLFARLASQDGEGLINAPWPQSF